MATFFSPWPSHVLGTACIGRGLMGILSPRNEYGHVGLPLESHAAAAAGSRGGFASPLMYFKGIREITFGLTLVALQWQGNEDAVTTVAAVLSLARFGDGLVVWLNGGDELRWKALGHWITSAGFVGWVIWRRSY
ncbi:hypothetical protein TOPH_05884 [Tolypocladium ophioglossoides CBS 100239]|uniref:Uncharacterized protein n=1 Tax=Tolypocladium ophioglossoides (strain CBS 100239) TaxID=1163406 RepID=A0A0L0N625_TOLOC|nr:hypothetical protein TOPH_05884 [Tolypocladium ophioglossoides CBS 100239]